MRRFSGNEIEKKHGQLVGDVDDDDHEGSSNFVVEYFPLMELMKKGNLNPEYIRIMIKKCLNIQRRLNLQST